MVDINKAYRKISLDLHPDKNPSEEAQKLFTAVNSIIAILKNEEHRAIYDQHLRQGIPVWRGTGYYYHLWQPNVLTIMIAIFIVLNVMQYCCGWAFYAQKLYFAYEKNSEINAMNRAQLKRFLKKYGIEWDSIRHKIGKFDSMPNVEILKQIGIQHGSIADEYFGGIEPQPPHVKDVFAFKMVTILFKQKQEKKE